MLTSKNVYITVDDAELELAVAQFLRDKAVLGPDEEYELAYYENWNNDTYAVFTVQPLTIANIASLNDSFEERLADILNWMCSESVIESGEYLVKVSW